MSINFTCGSETLTEEEMEALGWVTIERYQEQVDLADSWEEDYYNLELEYDTLQEELDSLLSEEEEESNEDSK